MRGRIKWYDPVNGRGAVTPDDGGGTVLILTHFDVSEGDPVDIEWELRESGRAVMTALTTKGTP